MPTWLDCATYTPISCVASVTRYWPIGGTLHAQAIVQYQRYLVRDSYTWANLWCRVKTNTAVNAVDLQSYIGAGAGNQAISIPAGTTGTFHDAVNSDALVSGNLICWRTVNPGAGAASLTIIGCTLATAVNTTPILMNTGSYNFPDSSTRYTGLMGRLSSHAWDEARTQYTFRAASTLSNMSFYVSANTLDGTVTVRVRVNGGNGNQVIVVGAGTSGLFEDAVNTDAISIGDEVNYQAVALGTAGTAMFRTFGIRSNSLGRQVVNANPNCGTIIQGLTRYLGAEGDASIHVVAEADYQVKALTRFTALFGYMYCAVNTATFTTTFTIRRNGANGAISMAVGAGLTGAFEDVVNTELYFAADLLNWLVVSGVGAGSMYPHILGFAIEQPPGPANIAEVDGVAAADIAEVDGIAWADIAEINGIA